MACFGAILALPCIVSTTIWTLDVAQKRNGLDLVLLLLTVVQAGLRIRAKILFWKESLMKQSRIATLLAVASPFMISMAEPGLTRVQNPSSQIVQPSASSGTQRDLYAEAFAGLTYTDEQKEAIIKIRKDIASRKAAVLKDEKLTQSQKDAMLTGYSRIEYGLIYKELTHEQQKQVSARMRALRASDQGAQDTQAPPR